MVINQRKPFMPYKCCKNDTVTLRMTILERLADVFFLLLTVHRNVRAYLINEWFFFFFTFLQMILELNREKNEAK